MTFTWATGSIVGSIVSWNANNSNQILVLAPTVAGVTAFSISVVTASAVAAVSEVSTEFVEPTQGIITLSLSQGPALVGFQITGPGGFGGTQPAAPNGVTLGGTSLVVAPGGWTDTLITVQVPATMTNGAAWPVTALNVVVTVPGGALFSTSPFTVTGSFGCVIQ